jgi:hypothetical protein
MLHLQTNVGSASVATKVGDFIERKTRELLSTPRSGDFLLSDEPEFAGMPQAQIAQAREAFERENGGFPRGWIPVYEVDGVDLSFRPV